MKKFLALVLAALMLLSFAAVAEEAIDPAELVVYNYEVVEGNHVTDWEGEWTLCGAYIGEDAELDETGLVEVEAGAITMTIETILDGSANDKDLGTMVDVANYFHDHVHDMAGVMVIGEEEYTLSSKWDQFPANPVTTGDYQGGFNYGPVQTKIKGEEDDVCFTALTGVEIEDLGDYKKYIGLNNYGNLVICFSDNNVAKGEDDIVCAYIFEKVVAE